MSINECNIIGEGGHWIVKRITINNNGQEKSVVRKHSKSRKVDDNISAFNLVSKAGLPTLNRFVKINELEIETEDLNVDTSNGYFVSPNTVRACLSYADLLIKMIEVKDLSKAEMVYLDDPFFMTALQQFKKGDINSIDIEKLRKKITIGAEGEVYNNKIDFISNLEPFLLKIKNDIEKAALHNIELFPDAFFFRVNILSGEIEYTIADFDCIRDLSHCNACYNDLIKVNMDHYKTALCEYIQFFVAKENQDVYIKCINEFK